MQGTRQPGSRKQRPAGVPTRAIGQPVGYDGPMNEGVYRVLAALADQAPHPRSEVIRRSGEAHSVIADLERRKPAWFASGGETLQLTEQGRRAWDFERTARTPRLDEEQLVAALEPIAAHRPPIRRDLDQVYATLPTVARRARRLIEAGEAQRGVLLLGDDDLTSVALRLLLDAGGSDRPVHVVEVDSELAAFLTEHGVHTTRHDLREPLPKPLRRRFGCVFTDPPYAPAGFALFVSRAVPALKEDGRLYVCFGQSRRAAERGLAKQRLLADLGVLVEEVLPDFNAYDGAESIGARGALWITRRTPQTRPLPLDEDAPLYTRSS